MGSECAVVCYVCQLGMIKNSQLLQSSMYATFCVCTTTALTGKLDVVSMAKLLLRPPSYWKFCQKGRKAM